MTLYEFTLLDINSRAQYLWENGLFVDSYTDNKNKINLYYVSNFYVEVFLNRSSSEITDVSPFKQGYRLDKYLNKVEIKL